MIISIASGKGGTGKTTVATNLALSLNDGIRLLDCDVEEPNCHLFLHPEITDTREVTTCIPVVRRESCTGCRKCAEICRFAAISEDFIVDPTGCEGCGVCVDLCPEHAIVGATALVIVVEPTVSGLHDMARVADLAAHFRGSSD